MNKKALRPFAQAGERSLSLGLLLGLLLLAVCLISSMTLGATDIPLNRVLSAVFAFDGSKDHIIVTSIRLPRALIAILIGASLSVAGAILQGLTRNPLADSGILAIEAGAVLTLVTVTSLLKISAANFQMIYSFVGAGITVVIVYLLASLGKGGLTSLNLIIVGASLSALFFSLTTGILIINQSSLEEIRFWLAGSLSGSNLMVVLQLFPYTLITLLIAFSLGKQISIINLGEDVAKGLGQKTLLIKIIAAFSVTILAGSSVAIAGPIGFIGMIVPHGARFLVGVDYAWILPYSALLGGIFLSITDLGMRIFSSGQELPIGVITAIFGGPFFLYIARYGVK